MARISAARLASLMGVVLAGVLVVAVTTEARAQFGSIFGQSPRPPANIGQPDSIIQEPDIQEPDEEAVPDLPPGPGRVLPAQPSLIAPPAGVQSQPLPPPPGAQEAPVQEPAQQDAPAQAMPGQMPPDHQRLGQPPLTGLPPGQRQPRGTPAAPGALQPGDEVVTEPPEQKIVNKRAMFSGLDKITGRVINFDVAIDETVQFGALRITPRACYTRPPTETANTDGFVEVDEITLKGEVKRIFSGWMFAASPGLHAVEHPVYDIWLTDCREPETAVAGASESDKPKPAPKSPGARSQSDPRSHRQQSSVPQR